MHNRIDWCVRGYSHGFYNRGQDSAGLLMYEQSSGNTVASNSITHGGDGLFLWAGQSTMDTGQGGATTTILRNDFSHAPANGIEATFSRNTFVGTGSRSAGTACGAATARSRVDRQPVRAEHRGHRDRARAEQRDPRQYLRGDETAIRLWQNASQDPNWGYPKHRDTRSRRYRIGGSNAFQETESR